MLNKIIKKFHVDQAKLKRYPWIRWLGPFVFAPEFWQMNRHNVPRAVFIGLFCACMPLPIQVLIAAIWALIWRAYLPFSIGLVWLSNPLTMPPIYYFCYKVGAWLLQVPVRNVHFHLTWSWFTQEVVAIWKPLLLGCGVCGLVAGGLGYFTVSAIWRYRIIQRWQNRKQPAVNLNLL